MLSAFEQAHVRLVDQLIAHGNVWSRPLIEAFRATPRHLFLDRVFHYHKQGGGWRTVRTANPASAEIELLYSDRALTTRLGEEEGQPGVPISSSSQPSLMAQMLEDLQLEPGLRVLEIGAGTGYNAALLGHVVGEQGNILSIDVDRRILAEAEEHLQAFPLRPVRFLHADGRQGYPEEAPYPRIIVTAATPDLEPAWLDQLAPGGLLLAPLDLAPGLAFLVCGTVRDGVLVGRAVRPAYFMPLRAEYETGRECAPTSPFPPPRSLADTPAPWADWPDQRHAGSRITFVQALAFLGWLEGLAVSCVDFHPEGTLYGVGDARRDTYCWMGARQWRATGPEGLELAERLWRTFLESGGPRPMEFRVRALPLSHSPDAPPEWPGEGTLDEPALKSLLRYQRRGERCWQLWELPAYRQRVDWE